MQRGTIIKHRASWTLLYYDLQYRNGKRKRVRVSKKLAAVSPAYPTKASVRQLADDILTPLNRKKLQPESSLRMTDFIENRYFPAILHELKPSTVNSYKNAIYYPHLKKRLDNPPIRLRDFRTVDAQRILRDIPNVSHTTLLHFKNFLSGVFKFAKQEGVLDGENPLNDAKVPGRPTKFRGAAYSIEDAQAMDDALEDAQRLASNQEIYETARDVLATLSFSGLRQSEARALRWGDWNEKEETLMVSRAIWGTRLGSTKNPSSENIIPVLPLLKELLERRRNRVKPNSPDEYIFAGVKHKTALDFHNLQNRIIKPALLKSELEWKGFHGFRRGLATNLLELGVNPVVIARILRHSDVTVTLAHYAKSRDAESKTAMSKLEESIRNRPSNVLIGGKEVGHGSQSE